jgi:hypothetical protein
MLKYNIIMAIKPRRASWEENVAHMGWGRAIRNPYEILVKKSEGKEHEYIQDHI